MRCFILLLLAQCTLVKCFRVSHIPKSHGLHKKSTFLYATAKDENSMKVGSGVDEYKNAATSILSNFMQKENDTDGSFNPINDIDFDAEKLPSYVSKENIELFAQMIDAELYEKEWFVTGKVNPVYFSDNFEFQGESMLVCCPH